MNKRAAIVTGTVSAVLAGIILQALNLLWPALRGIGNALTTAYAWLGTTTSVPHWLLIVLGLALAAWVFVLGAAALSSPKREAGRAELKQLGFQIDYMDDTFFGMRWRWRWSGQTPVDPVPFCPSWLNRARTQHDWIENPPTTRKVVRAAIDKAKKPSSRTRAR